MGKRVDLELTVPGPTMSPIEFLFDMSRNLSKSNQGRCKGEKQVRAQRSKGKSKKRDVSGLTYEGCGNEEREENENRSI